MGLWGRIGRGVAEECNWLTILHYDSTYAIAKGI